jgi:hypothetical protein
MGRAEDDTLTPTSKCLKHQSFLFLQDPHLSVYAFLTMCFGQKQLVIFQKFEPKPVFIQSFNNHS